ncbi:hypothetical protein SGPA1_50477 [Streptomyces misionensis JCM 4497]
MLATAAIPVRVRCSAGSKWINTLRERSDGKRQEVAAGRDATVRRARAEAAKKAADKRSCTDLARGE